MFLLAEQAKHRSEEDNINLILNSEESLDKFWASQMDQKNIQNFIDTFAERKPKIVLSTSWRTLKNIKKWNEQFRKIKDWNFEIIDRTPSLEVKKEIQTINGYWRTNPRGLEIKTWIEENNYEGEYLIIDDDDDMLPEQKDFFIHTNTDIGFLKEDCKRILGNRTIRESVQNYSIMPLITTTETKDYSGNSTKNEFQTGSIPLTDSKTTETEEN